MTESTGCPFARDPRRPASCEPRRDPGAIKHNVVLNHEKMCYYEIATIRLVLYSAQGP